MSARNGNSWIYIFGELQGGDGPYPDVKIGITSKSLREYQADLERARRHANHGDSRLVLLAALRGDRANESAIHRYFDEERIQSENFVGSERLVSWVNWLRGQWFTTQSIENPLSDLMTGFDRWCPAGDRVAPHRPRFNGEGRMFDVNIVFEGPLAGTPWNWMHAESHVVDGDYFTPVELVNAGREAMGGIDLDPATHYAANRVHRIPTAYTRDDDGLREDRTWRGRLWMNPPYGKNEPWFTKLCQHYERGDVEQACYLAPMWVFITGLAHRTILRHTSSLLLLSPTPRFWGNPAISPKTGRALTGRNDPHGIAYLGPHPEAFRRAFHPFGGTLTPEYDPELPAFVPRTVEEVYAATAELLDQETPHRRRMPA